MYHICMLVYVCVCVCECVCVCAGVCICVAVFSFLNYISRIKQTILRLVHGCTTFFVCLFVCFCRDYNNLGILLINVADTLMKLNLCSFCAWQYGIYQSLHLSPVF